MEEFLETYSYLTIEDYMATYDNLMSVNFENVNKITMYKQTEQC